MSTAGIESSDAESGVRDGRQRARRVAAYLVVCAAVGALAGLAWVVSVRPPAYEVRADHRAVMTERGLTQIFAIDASFVVVGFFASLLLGLVAWVLFLRRGWRTTGLATVGSFLGGLMCLVVGQSLTPGRLEPRLAGARPGASVPVEFVLGSPSAMMIWPFGAALVVLAMASLRPDPEENVDGES